MILTEEKTYIINVTEVDTDAELGLNKKDIMIKYTNLELLHAVLASTMPYGRLSARYRGKRKAELQSRIAMVESVLETRGDQLAKAEQESRTHGASGSRSAEARTARRPLETDAGRRRRSRRSMKIRWRRVRRA